jgi:hypothetical protein
MWLSFRWTLGRYVTISRSERTWPQANQPVPDPEDQREKQQEELLSPLLREIMEKQKARAAERTEEELVTRASAFYRELQQVRWGTAHRGGWREGDAMLMEQALAIRDAVAELLRRVAWRRQGRGKNGWSWTRRDKSGAPGTYFSTAEEASLYLLLKYGSAWKALGQEAKTREEHTTPTGKDEIDDRLREWGFLK